MPTPQTLKEKALKDFTPVTAINQAVLPNNNDYQFTPNLGLIKAGQNNYYDIREQGFNMEVLDRILNNMLLAGYSKEEIDHFLQTIATDHYTKTETNTLLDNKVNQSANVYQLPLSLGVTKVNASTYFKQGNIVTLTMKLLIEYQKLENYRIATLPIGFHPSSEFTHCGAYMQYLNQEGHIAATCGTGIWIAPLDGAIFISEFYGNPFVNDRVNYPKAYVMASMSFSVL